MDWDSLPKPWSREKCEERFVKGEDRLSIRKMAAASGRAKSTIEDWMDKDNWEDKRGRYQDEIRATTQAKTIEKVSDRLSDDLSKIITKNYKVHEVFRDCAHAYAQIQARYLLEIQRMEPDKQREALKKINAKEMSDWSMIASRSTQGISDAMGLPYWANLNTAFKKVEDTGYIVIDPTQVDNDEGDR
jgi:hypothetical protein